MLCGKVNFINEITPFGIAFLAACAVVKIPVFPVILFSSISMLIFNDGNACLEYLLMSTVFIGLFLGFKNRYYDLKMSIGVKLFLSATITSVIGFFFKPVLAYDVMQSILFVTCSIIFYILFANGMPVVLDFGKKKYYTKEEIIGSSILLSLAICAFGGLSIFGTSIKTVLCILVVLVLGWKNGALVGTVSGLVIGLVLGIIGLGDIPLIASFAVSGLVAGLFRKLRKNRSCGRIYIGKYTINVCG